MTLHQQGRLIESLNEFVPVFKERGIALVVNPEFGGQKVFAISGDGPSLHGSVGRDGNGDGRNQGSP